VFPVAAAVKFCDCRSPRIRLPARATALGAISDVELGKDAAQLGLDRVLAEVEMRAQLPIGHAGGQEGQQFAFTFCQPDIATGPAQLGRHHRAL